MEGPKICPTYLYFCEAIKGWHNLGIAARCKTRKISNSVFMSGDVGLCNQVGIRTYLESGGGSQAFCRSYYTCAARETQSQDPHFWQKLESCEQLIWPCST